MIKVTSHLLTNLVKCCFLVNKNKIRYRYQNKLYILFEDKKPFYHIKSCYLSKKKIYQKLLQFMALVC